ncbi:MAG TPA: hypothetical protein VMC03_22845 [Streptosporangiaceae bacterium]|nr:hypothetical protein [Streptosporangiaceae bacterium]
MQTIDEPGRRVVAGFGLTRRRRQLRRYVRRLVSLQHDYGHQHWRVREIPGEFVAQVQHLGGRGRFVLLFLGLNGRHAADSSWISAIAQIVETLHSATDRPDNKLRKGQRFAPV